MSIIFYILEMRKRGRERKKVKERERETEMESQRERRVLSQKDLEIPVLLIPVQLWQAVFPL